MESLNENLKSSATSNCSSTHNDNYLKMKDSGLDSVFFVRNYGFVQDDALNSLSLNYTDYELAQMPLDPRACVGYTKLILDRIVRVLKSDDGIQKADISRRLMNHIRKVDKDIFLHTQNQLLCITPIESRHELRKNVMEIINDTTIFAPSYLNGDDLDLYNSIIITSESNEPKTKKRGGCLIQ